MGHKEFKAEKSVREITMSKMTYNSKTNEYVLFSNDSARAQEVGLTLSKTARGQNNEKVWFTNTPYAALSYWDEADASVKARLAPLKADYDASWATDHPTNWPAPRGMEYLPFQNAAIDYCMKKHHALIADPPGVGKTPMSIGVANAMEAKRVLVVCPATIRLNWRREVLKWSMIKDVSVRPILKSKDGVSPYTNYNFVSYELTRMEGMHEALYALDWDLIIIDEAHYLKTPDAERTRAIFGGGRDFLSKTPLASKAKKIIALTGTPTPNRPREAYTLARALNWEAIDFASFDDFCYRFNPSARAEGSFHIIEKQGRLPELQNRLRCNLMIRRNKEDVLKDLPDKRYEFAYIEPNGEIKDVLAKERLLNFSVDDLKDPLSEIWGQISTIRREMGIAKVPRVIEHIRMLLDIVEIPKVVVFCHHRMVMDHLKLAFEGYGVAEVRGGMSQNAKGKAIDAFCNDPNTRIFLGQLDSAGFGIDGLQKVANWVVFAEPAWTSGTNEQAVDRCHRHGQHQNVIAQFLVVEGSLDERVLAGVIDKVHTIHGVLDKR